MPRQYTMSEACAILNRSRWTLLRWDKSGKLKAYRMRTTGHRYYTREQLDWVLGKPVAGTPNLGPDEPSICAGGVLSGLEEILQARRERAKARVDGQFTSEAREDNDE